MQAQREHSGLSCLSTTGECQNLRSPPVVPMASKVGDSILSRIVGPVLVAQQSVQGLCLWVEPWSKTDIRGIFNMVPLPGRSGLLISILAATVGRAQDIWISEDPDLQGSQVCRRATMPLTTQIDSPHTPVPQTPPLNVSRGNGTAQGPVPFHANFSPTPSPTPIDTLWVSRLKGQRVHKVRDYFEPNDGFPKQPSTPMDRAGRSGPLAGIFSFILRGQRKRRCP